MSIEYQFSHKKNTADTMLVSKRWLGGTLTKIGEMHSI